MSFPPASRLKICFAHAAYQLRQRFAARNTGIDSVEVYLNRIDTPQS